MAVDLLKNDHEINNNSILTGFLFFKTFKDTSMYVFCIYVEIFEI